MKDMRICHEPQPGETRDCLDPWKLTFIKADGSVSLCCWAVPVGNINDQPVHDILTGEPARDVRRGLLTGDLPPDCANCAARALIPIEDLREKVETFMSDDDRQGKLKMRSEMYEMQDEITTLRHDLTSKKIHATNLEDERDHLKTHVDVLLEQAHSIREGRASLRELLYTWTRGRLRRSALGQWWINSRSR